MIAALLVFSAATLLLYRLIFGVYPDTCSIIFAFFVVWGADFICTCWEQYGIDRE